MVKGLLSVVHMGTVLFPFFLNRSIQYSNIAVGFKYDIFARVSNVSASFVVSVYYS